LHKWLPFEAQHECASVIPTSTRLFRLTTVAVCAQLEEKSTGNGKKLPISSALIPVLKEKHGTVVPIGPRLTNAVLGIFRNLKSLTIGFVAFFQAHALLSRLWYSCRLRSRKYTIFVGKYLLLLFDTGGSRETAISYF
jgi:hypothetical protein